MESHEPRPVTFLLGAGASAEAGLPVSRAITQKMIDKLSDQRRNDQASSAFNFVVSAIIADDGRSGRRPDELPDIERVASAIELLASRADLEISPFVSTWEPALTALESAPAREPAFLERDLVRALTGQRGGVYPRKGTAPAEPDGRRLVKLLRDLISSQVAGGPSPVFSRLLNMLVEYLVDILRIPDDSSFDYLTPLTCVSNPGSEVTTISTLNYDLGLELVASRNGVDLSTGIADWAQTGMLDFSSAPLRLLKLHGSLDWQRERNRSLLTPRSGLVSEDSMRTRPFIVFGQREKLRAEGPFLQLLEAFRSTLQAAATLVVLGYAFRDDHINECIARWLLGNEDRRLLIVDPFFPESPGWGRELDFQRDLLRWQHSAGHDQESVRVCIRRQKASEFLTDLEALGAAALLESAFAAPSQDGVGDDEP